MRNRCIGFIELRDLNTPWRDVLHLGVRRTHKKGEHIAHNDQLFFLEKGLVRLTHNSRDGKEKILWYIGAGCIFGETPFFDSLDLSGESSQVCALDCVVHVFSRECVFNDIFVQRPDLAMDLLPSMARKVRILSNQASSLYVDDVAIRLCKFLGQKLVPGSDPLQARPGISRQEMSSLLGVHRITLFKSIKHLEDCGLLYPHIRGEFTILQPEEFFRFVNA